MITGANIYPLQYCQAMPAPYLIAGGLTAQILAHEALAWWLIRLRHSVLITTEQYSVLITTEQYSWLNEVYVLPSHLSQMGSTQNAASIQCGLKKNVETMNWIVFLHEVNTFASEPSLMKCYSISLALHSSYVLIELDPTRPSLKLGLIDRLVKHSIFKRHNDLK